MQTSQQKLQELLQQLFRTDNADLEFGIYRIINYRRDKIQHFIHEELPAIVNDALDANSEADSARQEIETLARQISQTLGADVVDADGDLINDAYRETPLVQQYLEAQERHGPGTSAKTLYIITFTRSSPVTMKMVILFPVDVTPKPNATPSRTTAKRSTSTGRIEINIMSRVASISPLIVSSP